MSLGGQMLEQRFGTPLNLEPVNAFAIGRFLRVLNGAFNIDIAKQRLEGANTLVNRFHDTRADVQKKLMELAVVEIDDALQVLAEEFDLYPIATERLNQAKQEIALGLVATSWSVRQNRRTGSRTASRAVSTRVTSSGRTSTSCSARAT
jgi:hypothetical protein